MQLSQMQKLLDQSQQLQLMAEKKIAALEAPKGAETPVQPETVMQTKKRTQSVKAGVLVPHLQINVNAIGTGCAMIIAVEYERK